MEFKDYIINISIDDASRKFSGKEKITLAASDEEVFLNAVDLEVGSIKVNGKSSSFSVDKEKEEVRLEGKFNGDLELDIEFGGEIKEVLMGLYSSRTSSGDFFTTQFESTGARRAFPCMDNPGYKAGFSLTLEIPEGLDAISNMPAKSVDSAGGRKTVEFEKTPRMSTYLLYMGIGRFDEKVDKFNDLEIAVSAPKGHLGEVALPFQFARESIQNYEEYFGIKYVLPKMHLISVPDFGAGAMENWGAITFREVLLNVSESTSAMVKRTIAEVIAHEIAHQWFGNLVTMKWWNDLWLNESFATFMAYKTIDRYHKDWDMWGLFLLSETSGALSGDSLKDSHPIDVKVQNPEDVAQIFDEISYGKGASILRMIESFVGEENFRDGIRKYLKEHQFGNAVGKDLWNSISGVSDQPVEDIMGAWISKQGYPVVSARKNGDKITLEQKRFLISGEETSDIWPIPLTVKTGDGVKSILFKDRTMEISSDGFLKLNADQTGFYRVDYEGALFDTVGKSLSSLTDLDKWGLASDLYAFLTAGRISLEQYLSRISALADDTSPILAESLSGQLMGLNLIITGNSRLKEVSEKFYTTQLRNVGDKKPGEPDRISILRGNLASSYVTINGDYSARLAGMFDEYTKADPDMRTAVATASAISRNDAESLASKLKDASSDEDRIKIIGAMGWLSGEENYRRVLELIQDGTIRKQDMLRFYMSAAMNPKGRGFVLNEFENMVAELKKYFVGTAYAGMVIEATLPYIGLEDYSLAREKAQKVMQPDTRNGVLKGLETLEVYSRLKGSGS